MRRHHLLASVALRGLLLSGLILGGAAQAQQQPDPTLSNSQDVVAAPQGNAPPTDISGLTDEQRAYRAERRKIATPSKNEFVKVIDEDIAKGRLTPLQGRDLLTEYLGVRDNLDVKIDGMGSGLRRDVIPDATTLLDSVDKLKTDIKSDNATSAGLAEGFVDTTHGMAKTTSGLVREVTPLLGDVLTQMSVIMTHRADTINANPNVPASERRQIKKESDEFNSYIRTSLGSKLGTIQKNVDTVVDNLEDPAKRAKQAKKIETEIDKQGGPKALRDKLDLLESNPTIFHAQQATQAAMDIPFVPEWAVEPEPGGTGEPVPQPSGRPTRTSTGHAATSQPSDPYDGFHVPDQGEVDPNPKPIPVKKVTPEPLPPTPPLPPKGNAAKHAAQVTKQAELAAQDNATQPAVHATNLTRNALNGDSAAVARRVTNDTAAQANGGAERQARLVTDTAINVVPGDAAAIARRVTQNAMPPVPARLVPVQLMPLGYVPSGRSALLTLSLLAMGAIYDTNTPAATPATTRTPGRAAQDATSAASLARASASGQTAPTTLAQQTLAQQTFVQPRQPGGPDYPQAPQRLTRTQTQGARDGQFSAADAFSGAAAAAANVNAAAAQQPDAVDIARQRIDDNFNAAMDRWNAYADTVYYDANGTLHYEHPAVNGVASGHAQATADMAGQAVEMPGNASGLAHDAAAEAAIIDAWQGFEVGERLTVAQLAPIYAGYNMDTMPLGSSGRSLSSAGVSPSSVGNSMSSAGNSIALDWHLPPYGPTTAQLAMDRANGLLLAAADDIHMPVHWGGDNITSDPIRVSGSGRITDPALASLYSLRNVNPYDPFGGVPLYSDRPLVETSHDLAAQLYGPLWSDHPYRLQAGAGMQGGGFHSGTDVATLSGLTPDELRLVTANDVNGGLSRLLAQPFNVLLTWGANAYDLDLHMTGPLAEGSADRFHIYYAARGALDKAPFAELIKDCICNTGSEVILTSALVRGQVYRISVFNYGNQSASSTNLSSASLATLQIVRGGTAQSQGNGTTIVGGHIIYTGTPTAGQAGNTWLAVEIDPKTGRIRAPNTITQTNGSDNVH